MPRVHLHRQGKGSSELAGENGEERGLQARYDPAFTWQVRRAWRTERYLEIKISPGLFSFLFSRLFQALEEEQWSNGVWRWLMDLRLEKGDQWGAPDTIHSWSSGGLEWGMAMGMAMSQHEGCQVGVTEKRYRKRRATCDMRMAQGCLSAANFYWILNHLLSHQAEGVLSLLQSIRCSTQMPYGINITWGFGLDFL